MGITAAVISTISSMPVTMVPRIISRPIINGRAIISIIRVSIIGAIRIIAGANPDSDCNMHSGIGLAGDAQSSQQGDD